MDEQTAKQAVQIITRLKRELQQQREEARQPVAIVGLSCRLPAGHDSPEKMWSMLLNGVDTTSEVPPSRWGVDEFYNADARIPGRMTTRRGAFVDDVDGFDAEFFGISRRDADNMDPQHRLFLELAWEALEDAGVPLPELQGSKTSVFAGLMNNDYQRIMWRDPKKIDPYSTTGFAFSMGINRLSYLFDLRGPNLALDTACSSSMVALHLACQSLRSGESDTSIVGGLNLLLGPESSIAFSKIGMLSPDGRCKTFDARANGYVRGEGGVVVVLKRLADARAHGDRIWAIVRGTSVNHDGRSNGYTAPNPRAHAAAMGEALEMAQVDPSEVSYIEAHGTGTPLGDAVEMDGLAEVYGGPSDNAPTCFVGSIKTNIGHLESAAGLAGVVKAAMAMKQGVVPPNLNFETLNPHIQLEATRFRLPTECHRWPAVPRRLAAVSSYGAGGTNSHAILEGVAYEVEDTTSPTPRQEWILPLSARHPDALAELAERFEGLLTRVSDAELLDICHTAALRRTHHRERLAVVAPDREGLRERLMAFRNAQPMAGIVSGLASERPPKVAFVFSGHGAEWAGMGRALIAHSEEFRRSLAEFDAAAAGKAPWSVTELLQSDRALAKIDELNANQPVLVAMQIALARTWRSWGVEPDAVIGHSLGEIAAAHVAGVLGLEDTVDIILARAAAIAKVRGKGGMALVGLNPEQVQSRLKGFKDRIWLAAFNSPDNTAVAGDVGSLEQFIDRANADGVFCRRILIPFASHSPLMDPVAAEFMANIRAITPAAGEVPIYSSTRGAIVEGRALDARHWGDNLREPVKFSDGIGAMLDDEITTIVEISTHPLLTRAITGIARSREGLEVRCLPSTRRDESDTQVMSETLAALHTMGRSVRWSHLYSAGRKADVPTYPWQHTSHWISPGPGHHGDAPSRAGHPLLGEPVYSSVDVDTVLWETEVSVSSLPYLADHRVRGVPVFPAAGFVEMARAGAQAVVDERASIESIDFEQALMLPEGRARRVQLVLRKGAERTTFQIASRALDDRATEWSVHARGRLVREGEEVGSVGPSPRPPAAELTALSASDHYDRAKQRGLEYGPFFRAVDHVEFADGFAVGRLQELDAIVAEHECYGIHPALLDACFQIALATIPRGETLGSSRDTFLPVSAGAVRWSRAEIVAPLSVDAHLDDHRPELESYRMDLVVRDDTGAVVLTVDELVLRRLERDLQAILRPRLFSEQWVSIPRSTPSDDEREGTWVLLGDRAGCAKSLRDRLETNGEPCLLILPGEGVVGPRAGVIEVDPRSREQLTEALKGVQACRGIVNLWPLHADADGTSQADAWDLTAVSALHALQVQADICPRAPVYLVTRKTRSARAELSAQSVAQASVVGIARVALSENPHLRCRCVDIDDASASSLDGLLHELFVEDEAEVCLMGSERLAPRLSQGAYALENAPESSSEYGTLITGGLGSLGLATAERLVERGARHVVLVGRSAPDESVRARISAMNHRGATVVAERLDVSDYDQVEALIARFGEQWPPLGDVLHAAGVLDDGVLSSQSREQLHRVWSPKVRGALNLERATRHCTLRSFVLFSSAAGLLGNPGQAGYAAANVALDALAHARSEAGRVATSIDWGAWSEVGLAAQMTDAQREGLEKKGLKFLSPDEGLMAFELTRRITDAQVAVMSFDADAWTRTHSSPLRAPYFSNFSVEDGESAINEIALDELLGLSQSARHRRVVQYLAQLLAHILRLSGTKIDPDHSVFSLGFDSLTALDLRGRIAASLGVEISTAEIIEAPTCNLIAELITRRIDAGGGNDEDQELLNRIDDMSEEELDALLTEMNAP